MNYWAGRRVLVTGGTGLIGRAVVGDLAQRGAKVTSVSRDRLDLGVENVYGDLADSQLAEYVMRRVKPESVFHLAGVKGSPVVTRERPASFMAPMLQMNVNVLEAARKAGVRSLLFASSIGAYPLAEEFSEPELGGWVDAPMDEYPGWAKLATEKLIAAYREEFGLAYRVVRPSNVYGPGDNFDPDSAMVIPALIARAAGGERPLGVWGDGTAVRDFVYVQDVAVGMLAALASEDWGVVNLGSGTAHTVGEVAQIVAALAGTEVVFQPEKGGGFSRRVMSVEKARRAFGYNPQTSLEEGIERTWEWYLANPREHLKKQNYFKEWKRVESV